MVPRFLGLQCLLQLPLIIVLFQYLPLFVEVVVGQHHRESSRNKLSFVKKISILFVEVAYGRITVHGTYDFVEESTAIHVREQIFTGDRGNK